MHLTLALTLLVSLKGEVRLDGKRPLERTVFVELLRMGERIADRFTSADGSFVIEGLQPGLHLLIAHSAGYAQAEVTVNVLGESGDSDVVVNLTNYKPQNRVAKALTRSSRYLEEKRYGDAEHLLTDTIRRSPNEGDPYFALALVYFEQNRWEDAIAIGKQAHLRNHRVPDVHMLLAKSYARLGKKADVKAELEMFIKESLNGPAKAEARKILEMLQP